MGDFKIDEEGKLLKKIIFPIVKILLNVCMIPLCFIKIFHDVGILPGYDSNGEFITVKHHYYYSMSDNLKAYELQGFLPLLIGLIVCSVAVTVVSMAIKRDGWKKLSNVVFFVSFASFLILFTIASTVARGY